MAGGLVACGVAGCQTREPLEEPTLDDQATAIDSAMGAIIAAGACDDTGLYWTDTGEATGILSTGRSTGVAGVALGLLAGVRELQRKGLEAQGDEALDPEGSYLAVQSAAAWLEAHAQEGDAGLYWDQCVEPDPAAVPLEACPADSGVLGASCPEDRRRPATGLQDGVAGIGAFFLQLAVVPETSLPVDAEAAEEALLEAAGYLSVAQGAGDWLLSQATREGDAWYWPELGGSSGVEARYATSLATGAAGIGYFLVRLSEALETQEPGSGEPYLEGAARAADWLRQQQVAGELTAEGLETAYVPSDASSLAPLTGFYHGNAGVAYFFLAMYQATGAVCYADDARLLLAWLTGSSVLVEALNGVTWWPVPGETRGGTYTDAQQGNAGIGWTFLQAARVLETASIEVTARGVPSGAEPAGTAIDHLQVARRAATWLSNAEIAHYYQGLAWWPSQITPWSDASEAGRSDWLDEQTLWRTSPVSRYSTQYSGLLRGGAGIGTFFLALGREEDEGCFTAVADQASAWHYYQGSPDSAGGRWTWSTFAHRLISTEEIAGPTAPGYELGASGVITFLAADRAGDDGALATTTPDLLGFTSLTAPTILTLDCP